MKLLRPLFLMLALYSINANFAKILAQTTVNYDYDEAGSRIKRYLHITPVTTKSAADGSKNRGPAYNNAGDSTKDIFVEMEGNKKITIYPNPTKGQLLIETSGYEKETKTALYLYNLKGAILESKTNLGSTMLLDLSSYPRGTYLLKLMLGSKISECKIVKE